MEFVVLNGGSAEDAQVDKAADVLASFLGSIGQVAIYRMQDLSVADCLGCFGCWIKTPGQCVINDSAREIANKMCLSDLTVYVTPIVFGGYSYELKKVLDRQICTILPFFKKINGELHHPQRYDKTGKLAAIGVLPNPNSTSEEIFKTLLYRNSLNKQASHQAAAIVYDTDTPKQVEEKIINLLTQVEVKL
jgi:multimeric flavodoxin WrbA